jgi:hypothetical protein
MNFFPRFLDSRESNVYFNWSRVVKISTLFLSKKILSSPLFSEGDGAATLRRDAMGGTPSPFFFAQIVRSAFNGIRKETVCIESAESSG